LNANQVWAMIAVEVRDYKLQAGSDRCDRRPGDIRAGGRAACRNWRGCTGKRADNRAGQ
jgi:hypothetical protein